MSKKIISITVIIFSIVIGLNYFHIKEDFYRDDNYYLRHFLPNQVLLPGEKVSADYLNYAEESYPLPIDAVRPKGVPVAKLTATDKETRITVKNDNPLNFFAEIEGAVPETLTFNTFYYPGWIIEIDGQIVPASLGKFGEIIVSIPSGRHLLNIAFKDTPVRRVANIISVLTLVSLIMLYVYYKIKTHESKTKRNR